MPASTLIEGAIVDGFQIGERLHSGGMANLWAVTRDDIDTPLVMKAPIESSADPLTIVGFEMEQMILPLLQGAHVPKIFAMGAFAAQPYIVMERIGGGSLLAKLDEMPLPVEEIVKIGIVLAEALDDIHRQHVIHFDIKPSNVMMRESGEAVLIDFGLARHEKLPDLLAEEFRVPIGTAPYISPEQVRRCRNDPRSDLFAAGVLLYHLLTGQRPFGYPRSNRGLRRRLWRDPIPPRALNPACPPFLQELILRCLETNPEARHPTAAQLAFDLKHRDDIRLTERATKLQRDSYWRALKRWYAIAFAPEHDAKPLAQHLSGAPIIMVAVDMIDHAAAITEAQRTAVERALASTTGLSAGNAGQVRLACVNVLKTNRLALNYPLDEEGRNIHVMRLVALKEWARPLALGAAELSIHVLESPDPAAALIDFATVNRVDQIILGAGRASVSGPHLGPVAARIAAEAPCSVMLVKARHGY
jgi:nucleotide-binding universal stress UspA family protein